MTAKKPAELLKRCGAQLRNKPGQFCTQWALTGSTRCKFHGGKNPVGAAHPSFKTGRYSKLFKGHRAERFEAAMNDPDKLSMANELAAMDVLIEESMGRLDDPESRTTFADLKAIMGDLRRAEQAKDPSGMAKHLTRLGEAIDTGAKAYGARDEVIRLFEKRMKLVESERKRLIELRQMMSVDEINAQTILIVDVIRRHVKDRETQGAIAREIAVIAGQTVAYAPGPGHPAWSAGKAITEPGDRYAGEAES